MRSAPQEGAAGAPQPRHMTPCVCHCAACRAAGHGDGACVVLCAGLHALFDGKADVVDLVLRHMRHYYGACGWDTARFDAKISCVQYGPGVGDVIAAGADDGRIHFICAQTGEKILCPLSGHSDWIFSVAWSPDGTKLASGSGDKTVRVWEAATGKQLSQLRGEKQINSVAFSPDGSLIAAGDGGFGDEGTIRLYNAATGDPFGSPLRGHSAAVGSVCFSSDGKKLTSGSEDTTVRNWDPATRAGL